MSAHHPIRPGMHGPRLPWVCAILLVIVQGDNAAAELVQESLEVDGTEREYLVYSPPGDGPAPLVFVFHGHGGNMRTFSRRFPIHEHWPQARVVYPQGLPSPGKYDPSGLRPGWQKSAGELGDRDLGFFDAVYAALEPVTDRTRVFATGHSNGGRFAYLLWAHRGDRVTALAPSSSTAGGLLKYFAPKPVLHLAGKDDGVVPFRSQQATIRALRQVNGCDGPGRPWMPSARLEGTAYDCKDDRVVVTLIHDGGHRLPADASRLIAAFFGQF